MSCQWPKHDLNGLSADLVVMAPIALPDPLSNASEGGDLFLVGGVGEVGVQFKV